MAIRGTKSEGRSPSLVWLGVCLAAGYWLAESLIHTYLFDDGSLAVTLLGENDPNEVWMRLLISVLFVAFGWVADRSIRAERRLNEDALRLSRLSGFVDQVRQGIRHAGKEHRFSPVAAHPSPPSLRVSPFTAGSRVDHAAAVKDVSINEDDIERLSRILKELSEYLDVRFNELHALLHLIHEVNKGLLFDEVLDRAYDTLKSVLPYNRLSVALIENEGKVARARWLRSDYPEIVLRKGYAGVMRGSSLHEVMLSGEPRIISDLEAYLEAYPHSDSTRLMVAEGIRSSLTCPLISMGKPIGFMFFSSRAPGVYENVHVDIFKLIAGHLSVVVEKSNLYQQILQEKEKSEILLLNVMPARIAARLSAGEKAVAESFPDVSVLFADIVAFTEFARRHSPERVVDLLRNIFVPLDRLCGLYAVEKIKTIGDQYMAMSVPLGGDYDGHLRNLAEFALEALRMVEGMRYPDGRRVSIRMGMHTGSGVAGVIGQEKFAYDVWGDAVNVASRMESSGEPGRIHVTGEIYSRLRDAFVFEERGEIDVKGIGPMKTYFLTAKKES
jgi:class 3 adenylate cyclase